MRKSLPPPEGYESRHIAGRTVYLLEEHARALEALGFVSGQALGQPIATLMGRRLHPVYRLPGTHHSVLWKQCTRGGLMEPLLGDRHWRVARFLEELRLTRAARLAGLGVAEVLGMAIASTGSGWKRVEMVTLVEEGARDLAAALDVRENAGGIRQPLSRAVANELRRFHGLGFLHGDLNVKNILWRVTDRGEYSVTLIDLDPAASRMRHATPLSNLLRLYRSVRKGEVAGKWRVNTTDLYRFLSEYFQGDRTGVRHCWREGRRRLGRWHPHVAARRTRAQRKPLL